MTGIPSLTQQIKSGHSIQKGSLFSLVIFVMKAPRDSPIERVWKIFANEGIRVVSGFCGLLLSFVAMVDCFLNVGADAGVLLQASEHPRLLGTFFNS